MKRGKLGICLAFYAVLAFVLALLKQPLLCGLLLGFVLLKEEDQWTVRQVLQGFMLSLLVLFALDTILTFTSFITYRFGFLFDFVSVVQGVFTVLVYGVSAVFAILGIVRVARDQEADLPLLSNLAYRVFGQQKPRPVKQAYPQQGYMPPMQAPGGASIPSGGASVPPGQPVPNQQPMPPSGLTAPPSGGTPLYQGQPGGVAVPVPPATVYQPYQGGPVAQQPYVDPNPTAQLPQIPVQPEVQPQPPQAQPVVQQPPQQP